MVAGDTDSLICEGNDNSREGGNANAHDEEQDLLSNHKKVTMRSRTFYQIIKRDGSAAEKVTVLTYAFLIYVTDLHI